MRPKRQILAGWATGLVAVAAGAIAMPAAADKAADQRNETTMADMAAEFRTMPVQNTVESSVKRLAELYGPDVAAETPLQRTHLDLAPIATETSTLRKMSDVKMDEAHCLAEAIYYESRSESRSGQVAVAQVIRNRVHSRHYPDTICGVVYQGSERTTGCQFSFTCDGSMDKAPKGKAWDRSEDVARYVLTESPRSRVGRSTHYHTDYVNPVWNKTLVKTAKVGTHIFYKFSFTERPRTAASVQVAPPS